jgi:glycosyltransferase involved in cell wall biosynthesis
MHILLIHQAFAALDEPGGTRHHEFARLLANRGHQISIIASPVSYLTGSKQKMEKVVKDMDGKIIIHRAYTYSALHKSFFHRLLSFFTFMVSSFFTAMRMKNVDIVWGTSPPIFQSITALLVARIKSAKFLLEIRDLWPAFAVAVGVLKNPTLINLSQRLEKFLYRHADQVIVNSPGYIQHVKERGARRISLIPNGADESFFSAHEPLELRKSLKWEHKFVILYAGAHGMSNDLMTVLAAAKLLESQKDILFVFLGDGKEKQKLIEESIALDLHNVRFLNPVPKTEIADFFQAANACLAILKPIEMYKTTYPNKVFDYMAAGKPIILVIDGVIREVIENAGCGIYCEPGNSQAISDCVTQLSALAESERVAMGEMGKHYLKEHFDRKNTVKIFSDMIEKMVKNNAG